MNQQRENHRQQLYESLHATYVRISHRQIPFTVRQIWAWEEWSQRGHFTLADLELVLDYIQTMIRKGERRIESLRFETITRDWGKFEDDLAQAKEDRAFQQKLKREKKPMQPAKLEVLRATGRLESETAVPLKVVTPAQIIPDNTQEVCAMLRKFADGL